MNSSLAYKAPQFKPIYRVLGLYVSGGAWRVTFKADFWWSHLIELTRWPFCCLRGKQYEVDMKRCKIMIVPSTGINGYIASRSIQEDIETSLSTSVQVQVATWCSGLQKVLFISPTTSERLRGPYRQDALMQKSALLRCQHASSVAAAMDESVRQKRHRGDEGSLLSRRV
jgi:hypothetical protein